MMLICQNVNKYRLKKPVYIPQSPQIIGTVVPKLPSMDIPQIEVRLRRIIGATKPINIKNVHVALSIFVVST